MKDDSQFDLPPTSQDYGRSSGRGQFFATPQRRELLEQLAYSAQFNGGIQVVEGPPESGKTVLAEALCKDYLSQCERLVLIAAARQSDAQAILRQTASALGLVTDETQPSGELIVALRHYVQSLQADSEVAILVIDDAHHLDQRTLAALASLLQGGGESGFGLHLVLWAEPGLVERLDDMRLVDIPVHDFQVPLLSVDEAATFLAQWLDGAQGDALSPVDAQQLWSISGGRIGVLQALVDDELKHRGEPEETDAAPSAGEGRGRRNLAGLPLAHVAALSLLVVVLVWALLAREPGSDQPEESGRIADVDPVRQRQSSQLAIPENPAQTASSSSVQERLDKEGGAESSGESLSLDPVIDERELRQALYGRQGQTADPGAQVQDIEPEPEPEPEPGQAQPEPEQQAQPEPTPEPEQTRDVRQLLAMDADSYSLQVMAAASLESLERFREGQPNRPRLYLYRTSRQGQPWYVLLAGNYSTREAAVQAIAELPAAQRSGGPWPRKLANIQQEIAEDRD